MASNGAGEEPVAAVAAPEEAAPAEILRRLDEIRSTLQTAVLDDVVALLAQPEAPDEPPLQRRARAIQIELTLRRQAVALEEWRHRAAAAEAETERQRQLFARLEAEFVQRNAALERAVAEAAEAAEAMRTERDAARTELSAALAERDAALAERKAALDEKIEFERRAGDKARDYGMASELAEARRQLAETLEQDLARTRRELGEVQQILARTLDEQRLSLGEAERRIEELRNSRWRQLGIGLGMAKRATFEK